MPPMHRPPSRELRRTSGGTHSSSVRERSALRRSFVAGLEGGTAFEGGAVVVAGGTVGGTVVTAGPVDGAAEGGVGAVEAGGEGAVVAGGAAASLDGGVSRFSKKELTADVTESQCPRAALMSPAYPEIRRPNPTKSRKPLSSINASRATMRKRI